MALSWREPPFETRPSYDAHLGRISMRPRVLGGRSKKDQLGSVAESWGGPSTEMVSGMFQIEADPPSRSTSPFKDESGVGLTIDNTKTYTQPISKSMSQIKKEVVSAPEPREKHPSRHEILMAKLQCLQLAREGTSQEGRKGVVKGYEQYGSIGTLSAMGSSKSRMPPRLDPAPSTERRTAAAIPQKRSSSPKMDSYLLAHSVVPSRYQPPWRNTIRHEANSEASEDPHRFSSSEQRPPSRVTTSRGSKADLTLWYEGQQAGSRGLR